MILRRVSCPGRWFNCEIKGNRRQVVRIESCLAKLRRALSGLIGVAGLIRVANFEVFAYFAVNTAAGLPWALQTFNVAPGRGNKNIIATRSNRQRQLIKATGIGHPGHRKSGGEP